ncbi:MAG: hypothetical protein M3R35_07255 [Candidatus Eremiobacteraeota bacterium]|nr:hypothetical protein [Candidatus Eremiobacteraeota bacterium]
MNRIARSAASALALITIAATAFLPAGAAAGSGPAANGAALLRKMAQVNPHLKSYTASIHADVTLHAFVSLSPTLDGTYYHKEPGKDKLVFTSGVPSIAKQFSKIYPHIDSPSSWNSVYVVSTGPDDGTYTAFKLVPRRNGRVDHIDVKVDDKLATISEMRWTYNDGGYALLDQTYKQIDGNYLVTHQTGHVDTPHYSADLVSTFSNFKVNVPISDAVFKAES